MNTDEQFKLSITKVWVMICHFYADYNLDIITTRNDQRPISPEFEQIMQYRNDFDTDLYVRYSFGDIDNQTYRSAYVWFNLLRYRDPLSQILFQENDVVSLYNLTLSVLRQKYRHIPTILGLRGQLPSLLIADLMEPLLPGIWHNLHNYHHSTSVARYIQQFNIDIGHLQIVEVLRLAAGMPLEVTICTKYKGNHLSTLYDYFDTSFMKTTWVRGILQCTIQNRISSLNIDQWGLEHQALDVLANNIMRQNLPLSSDNKLPRWVRFNLWVLINIYDDTVFNVSSEPDTTVHRFGSHIPIMHYNTERSWVGVLWLPPRC